MDIKICVSCFKTKEKSNVHKSAISTIFSHFLTDSWRVTKGSMLVAKGDKIGSLYIVENINEVGATMSVEDSNLELWHQRLDRMRKKGLVVMHKSEQLQGLKSIDLQFFDHILHGK